ncbi:hypothetical protein D3C85_1393890 [compost metagenome]
MPWRLKQGDESVEQDVPPAFVANEEELETDAVLGGRVLGQLTAVTAAAHIRTGRLVPLLTQHVADFSSVFVYYGSRVAQPARVRAFLDLAIARLANSPTYVLSQQELAAAEERGRALYVRAPQTAPTPV